MSFHPDSHLPDCMMPDGGECCAGYATICEDWHKQRRRIEKLERALHDLFFINLEYRDAGEWKYLAHPGSAFALAAKDSVLHDAGLTGDSVGDAQRFFNLSREELAEFSCVCGGSINNNEMADRIERVAARTAT